MKPAATAVRLWTPPSLRTTRTSIKEEDETADRFASPEDAKLEEDGGDLDDIAPPQIDAVDRADAAYDARS